MATSFGRCQIHILGSYVWQVVVAIVLGMAFHNAVRTPPYEKPALAFALKFSGLDKTTPDSAILLGLRTSSPFHSWLGLQTTTLSVAPVYIVCEG
jgi:hypothetical protein